jgi:pimeloyl-ACP methyl ester carboxylesterase
MINHFRSQMPRPIMGIGHSLGATSLLFASLMHPRLFNSLVLIEPHMTDNPLAGDGPLFVAMSTHKRDVWPSREQAVEKSFKVLKGWDPRVFELWKKYGYRDLPTAMYPAPTDATRPVTLTTTKHQETIMYTRPNVKRHTQLGLPRDQAYTEARPGETGPPHDPLLFPDVLGPLLPDQKSYRPEPILAFKMVEHLRPSTLYVSASHSPLGKGGEHRAAAKRTGTGVGGSGGMETGHVKFMKINRAGHTVPLEKVEETASVVGPWIKQEVQRWREDEMRVFEGWKDRPISERSGLPLDWNEVIGSLRLPERPSKI